MVEKTGLISSCDILLKFKLYGKYDEENENDITKKDLNHFSIEELIEQGYDPDLKKNKVSLFIKPDSA